MTAVVLEKSARRELAELADTAAPWEEVLEETIGWWFDRSGKLYTADPRILSPIPAGTDIRTAVVGARMLGLELTPQGCYAAAVLEARDGFGRPLYDDVTFQIPRRATKTTTVQLVLLGRCETRPGYYIIQTAQDGTRASLIFKEMIRNMKRATPNVEDRNWKEYESQGREYIEWTNGSRWWVVAPKAEAYRSQAADCLWFDECGELNLETSEDLEAGALPTQDTREDAQAIKSGTPGKFRAGLFWKSLEEAAKDPETFGVVNFSAADEDVVDAEGMTEDAILDLLERHHPGLACGLTTRAKMLKRLRAMTDLAKFIREYFCVWPPDTTQTALDQVRWVEGQVTPGGPPTGLPWAIGFDVAIGSVAGAIAAGWFDADGNPCAQIMEYRVRADWMPEELAKAIRAHPRVPVAYDNIGDNISVAQELGRKPRLKTTTLKALALREVAAATATVAKHNKDGTFRHGISASLDRAAAAATWRESGGSRLFRRLDGADISALLAVTHALAAASTLKKRAGAGVHKPLSE